MFGLICSSLGAMIYLLLFGKKNKMITLQLTIRVIFWIAFTLLFNSIIHR